MGQTMEKHYEFGVSYWHTFTGGGNDPFGAATAERAWNHLSGMDLAKARVEASFEFMIKSEFLTSVSMIVILLQKAIHCRKRTRT